MWFFVEHVNHRPGPRFRLALRSDGFILFIEMLENPEISFVNQTKDVPQNDSEESAFEMSVIGTYTISLFVGLSR